MPERHAKPLSVIFLNPILSDGWGGVEKWMIAVGRHLMSRGHTVVGAGADGCRWLRSCQEAGFHPEPVPIRADFHPGSVYRLRKCYARYGTDIVCVKMAKGVRMAGTACLLLPDPRPVVICRMGDAIMQRSRRARLTYQWLADAYVTPSEKTRSDLVAYGYFGPERIHCIPNGVDETTGSQEVRRRIREEFGIGDEKLVVVSSRLHPAKGHEYLFEAARQLAGSVRMRLLVVGNGAYGEKLKAQVAEMGLQGVVSFAGFRSDVHDLLQAADLAVLPSLLEGLPNNVLEAMAAGKPVVATAVDGVPEAVADGETGLLVPPANAAALARALAAVMTDDALAQRLGAAARERVRNEFSLRSMLERTEKIFLMRRDRRHRCSQ